MATVATKYDIGIRRDFTVGERNFENSGTVQYKSAVEGLYFNGNHYNIGAAIPFDVSGTHYSVDAIGLLEFYWNQEFIAPLA